MSSARDFLRSNPVPPGPSPYFDRWQAGCRQLGEDSTADLLDALQHGDEGEQYGAVIGLRVFGYEVWGVGYWDDLQYTVRPAGGEEVRTIVPDVRSPRPPC